MTVIRITSERLLAIPYQYEAKTWSDARGKILNVPIRGRHDKSPDWPCLRSAQRTFALPLIRGPLGTGRRSHGRRETCGRTPGGVGRPTNVEPAPNMEATALRVGFGNSRGKLRGGAMQNGHSRSP